MEGNYTSGLGGQGSIDWHNIVLKTTLKVHATKWLFVDNMGSTIFEILTTGKNEIRILIGFWLSFPIQKRHITKVLCPYICVVDPITFKNLK